MQAEGGAKQELLQLAQREHLQVLKEDDVSLMLSLGADEERNGGSFRVIDVEPLGMPAGFAVHLGSGCFGNVFKGKMADGKVVAFKVLAAPGPKAFTDALQEARVMVLDRKHEVFPRLRAVYVPTGGGPPALAMEFMNAMTMDRLLRNQNMVGWRRSYVLYDFMRLLGDLAALGAVHCDVKMDNVLAKYSVLHKDVLPLLALSDAGCAQLLDCPPILESLNGGRPAPPGNRFAVADEVLAEGILTPKYDMPAAGITMASATFLGTGIYEVPSRHGRLSQCMFRIVGAGHILLGTQDEAQGFPTSGPSLTVRQAEMIVVALLTASDPEERPTWGRVVAVMGKVVTVRAAMELITPGEHLVLAVECASARLLVEFAHEEVAARLPLPVRMQLADQYEAICSNVDRMKRQAMLEKDPEVPQVLPGVRLASRPPAGEFRERILRANPTFPRPEYVALNQAMADCCRFMRGPYTTLCYVQSIGDRSPDQVLEHAVAAVGEAAGPLFAAGGPDPQYQMRVVRAALREVLGLEHPSVGMEAVAAPVLSFLEKQLLPIVLGGAAGRLAALHTAHPLEADLQATERLLAATAAVGECSEALLHWGHHAAGMDIEKQRQVLAAVTMCNFISRQLKFGLEAACTRYPQMLHGLPLEQRMRRVNYTGGAGAAALLQIVNTLGPSGEPALLLKAVLAARHGVDAALAQVAVGEVFAAVRDQQLGALVTHASTSSGGSSVPSSSSAARSVPSTSGGGSGMASQGGDGGAAQPVHSLAAGLPPSAIVFSWAQPAAAAVAPTASAGSGGPTAGWRWAPPQQRPLAVAALEQLCGAGTAPGAQLAEGPAGATAGAAEGPLPGPSFDPLSSNVLNMLQSLPQPPAGVQQQVMDVLRRQPGGATEEQVQDSLAAQLPIIASACAAASDEGGRLSGSAAGLLQGASPSPQATAIPSGNHPTPALPLVTPSPAAPAMAPGPSAGAGAGCGSGTPGLRGGRQAGKGFNLCHAFKNLGFNFLRSPKVAPAAAPAPSPAPATGNKRQFAAALPAAKRGRRADAVLPENAAVNLPASASKPMTASRTGRASRSGGTNSLTMAERVKEASHKPVARGPHQGLLRCSKKNECGGWLLYGLGSSPATMQQSNTQVPTTKFSDNLLTAYATAAGNLGRFLADEGGADSRAALEAAHELPGGALASLTAEQWEDAVEVSMDFAVPRAHASTMPSVLLRQAPEGEGEGKSSAQLPSTVGSGGAGGSGHTRRRLYADFGAFLGQADGAVQAQREGLLLWVLGAAGVLHADGQGGGQVAVTYRLNHHATWLAPIKASKPSTTWRMDTI